MKEYELHTMGATHNYTPPFDSRDPTRNRSTAAPEDATIPIQRYDLDRLHRFGVGVPTIIPKDNGRYVKYEDHVAQLRAHELHNEMQLLMRKAVGEKLADALATINRLIARSGE